MFLDYDISVMLHWDIPPPKSTSFQVSHWNNSEVCRVPTSNFRRFCLAQNVNSSIAEQQAKNKAHKKAKPVCNDILINIMGCSTLVKYLIGYYLRMINSSGAW